MKGTKLPAERASQVAVLLPGLVGLAVVARALLVYVGQDAMASLIVVAMGVGLAVGLVELLLRQRRALALEHEVRALPSPVSDEAVDRASPLLRAFLRARIEHAPVPSLGESITPYLVGLMVMLGLLGTLLGLFETLNGAGHALTASANVDALRNGLSGPMRGLTRSFGCSAAGVSASAMLGLASVLVRRGEARALSAVHAYAMGPLRELSPIRRQLSSLDLLAVQGEALPRAATALEQAAARLGGLAERWEAAHKTATEAQQKASIDVVDKLRTELLKAANEAGRAMNDSVAPLVKQLVSQTGEAASRHMGATLEALERDLKARREADATMRAALRDELSALRSWAEVDSRSKADDTQKRLDVIEQAMTGHAEEQAALLSLQREQAIVHVSAIEGAARALTTQLSDEARARREESSSLLGDLAARLDQAAKDRAQESRDELAAIAALGSRITDEAHTRELALSARWQELSKAVEETTRTARDQDVERMSALRGELEAHSAALGEQWAALAERVEQTAGATRAEEEARLLRLDELAKRFGKDLGSLSASMGEQLTARMDAERGLAERTEQAMVQLEQSAKGLNDALERQDLAVQVLVERGSEQLAQITSASQHGAREALERLVQLSNDQAQRFVQLEAQLNAGQAAHTKALADELTGHAERLGKGLEGTTSLVNDAATVLKASSVEMSAVAEMFAKSVDRQREAAKAWMESLGELEGAIERAGRGAAADALGDQLASTQEVFARQLQFQRELFEQLRSLRVAPTPAAHGPEHGEHDVSA